MIDPNLIRSLRMEMEASIAKANAMEADVKFRQERLRVATEKVERLKGAVAVLEAEAAAEQAEQDTATGADPITPPPPPPPPTTDWRTSTKRARIETEVDGLLSLHGTMHRKVLLDHLINKGIMGTERNPLPYLAAFLSEKREKYEPDGRGNFTLRRPGASESPPAPNGAGYAAPQSSAQADAGGVAPPDGSVA